MIATHQGNCSAHERLCIALKNVCESVEKPVSADVSSRAVQGGSLLWCFALDPWNRINSRELIAVHLATPLSQFALQLTQKWAGFSLPDCRPPRPPRPGRAASPQPPAAHPGIHIPSSNQAGAHRRSLQLHML